MVLHFMPRVKKTARRPIRRSKIAGSSVTIGRCANRAGSAASVIMRRDGKRVKIKYCTTDSEAKALAQQWEIEITNVGTEAAASITDADKSNLMQAVAKLEPYGKTIWEAVDFYVQHMERSKASMTIDLLADKLITYKAAEGLSDRYRKDLDFRLKPFVRDFGSRIASDITTEEINAWLIGLELSPVSVNNYRRVLSVLFSHGVMLKAVDKDRKPTKGAFSPKVGEKDVVFLSIPETFALLKVASRDNEVLPIVALGLFAGVRTAEIKKLSWNHISLKVPKDEPKTKPSDRIWGYVRIPADIDAKTGKRKIPIREALYTWLAPIATLHGPIWPVHQERGRNLLEAVQAKAGFNDSNPWPSNAKRHTFGTYHAAQFQNLPALSIEMGNSVEVVKKHYYNPDPEMETAEQFWNLTREAVLSETKIVQMPTTAAS